MKLTLFPPRSTNLIFDRVPAAVRADAFSGVEASVIDTRFSEQIFLVPALMAAVKMLWTRNELDFSVRYLLYVIKFSRGNRVIGFSPLNKHLQQLALQLEKVEFHLFQSGIMSSTSTRSFEGEEADIYFAPNVTNYIFGRSHMMEKFSKQKVVNWGSVLNNLWLNDMSDETLVERVIFISQWRPFLNRPERLDDQALRRSLVEAFRQTLNWGNSRDIEVVVLGSPKISSCGSAEADFYEEVANRQVAIISPENARESYEKCQESKYISTFNSTLGIEMLGRGKVVAFWGLDEAQKPLLDVKTLNRYFGEMGLNINSSCNLGLQLDFFISNEAFVLSEDIRNEMMLVQPPHVQAAAIRNSMS